MYCLKSSTQHWIQKGDYYGLHYNRRTNEKAHEAEGKTFGEIDTTDRLANAKSKGGLGQVIEESFLDMK